MLVIYDLDKTSLYCPLANFMDKFIPRNIYLKTIYYSLYSFVHRLEMMFGLLQINKSMYVRAKSYSEFPDINQIVVTARHYSKTTVEHVHKVFHELDIPIVCVAQGLTNLSKAEVVRELPIYEDEEVVMYDDNFAELTFMYSEFKDHFTGIKVDFKNNKEEIERVY